MNIDPAQIRADIDRILADLPRFGTFAVDSGAEDAGSLDAVHVDDIEAVGQGLEKAHQILVNALESVEKG